MSATTLAESALDTHVGPVDVSRDEVILEAAGRGLDAQDRVPLEQAISYVSAYLDERFGGRKEQREIARLLLNGRTPREIIVLGHVIALERTKTEMLKDQLNIACPSQVASDADVSPETTRLKIRENEAREKVITDVIVHYSTHKG